MRSVHLAVAAGTTRLVQIVPASTNPTAFEVRNVPNDVQAPAVALHLQHIAFWPLPSVVDWPKVATLPRGSLVQDAL